MTCRIVAELSCNHLGSLDRALAIVQAAAKAGADAVKFQTYTPEQMVGPEVVIKAGPWAGRNALELYREAHTPREWYGELFTSARALGLEAFSSVFHPDDVDFLENFNCPRYKISSFELTDLALIKYAAATGKPIVLSTGMADLWDIALAIQAATPAGSDGSHLTLLKCTSAYPASIEDANLVTIADLESRIRFGNVAQHAKFGISDHTLGISVAVAAAVLFDVTMIEKHLTLRRADGGPDAAFSMEPEEFAQMVKVCREAKAAIGNTIRYGPTKGEAASLQLRRSPGGKRGERVET